MRAKASQAPPKPSKPSPGGSEASDVEAQISARPVRTPSAGLQHDGQTTACRPDRDQLPLWTAVTANACAERTWRPAWTCSKHPEASRATQRAGNAGGER